MRFDKMIPLAALIALITLTAVAPAQAQRWSDAYGLEPGKIPLAEVTLGYNYLHANAPPGLCGCFSANGGYGSIVVNAQHGISGVADFSAVHAGNVSGTGQSITVANYLFGPRYSFRSGSGRFTRYGQALFGVSSEQTNYVPSRELDGFAFSVGGGLNLTLKPRFAWNAIQLDWIHSQIANSSNNRQNDLSVRTGITVRF
jgi:hypothetical protein